MWWMAEDGARVYSFDCSTWIRLLCLCLCEVPGVAVVIVGSRKDSQSYVNMKRKACAEVEIESFDFDLPEQVSEAEVIQKVQDLNAHPDVHAGCHSNAEHHKTAGVVYIFSGSATILFGVFVALGMLLPIKDEIPIYTGSVAKGVADTLAVFSILLLPVSGAAVLVWGVELIKMIKGSLLLLWGLLIITIPFVLCCGLAPRKQNKSNNSPKPEAKVSPDPEAAQGCDSV